MLALVACAAFHNHARDVRVMQPYDYKYVSINDGMMRKQQDETKEFYLRIPNDDLLIGFRRRAGIPALGQELGGWYSSDTFNVFGQILSGLSRLYAATKDPACKAKAVALYDGWKQTIEPDGYFYASRKPNAPHYIYDKMVGGLVDLALYTGRKDALAPLAKITDWAEKNLDRTRPYGADGSEWYTLSENLYRAYDLTKDERYRRFAKVWEYSGYWTRLAKKRSIFEVGNWRSRPMGKVDVDSSPTPAPIRYHAYSHLNTLGGAAMAYRENHNPAYLDTIRNAYEFFQREECFATGGFGPNETLAPKAETEQMLDQTSATYETQCGSWAIFKLCKHLISLTGDAKYGDWIEQAVYNGLAATIPETPDGKVLYYSNYNPFGAKKVNHWDGWSCCTGTRPMAVADVTDLIYFKTDDGIAINLFVPSKFGGYVANQPLRILQTTQFPEGNTVHIDLISGGEKVFDLRFRAPGWLTGSPTFKISGKVVPVQKDKRGWFLIRRKWDGEGSIDITFPMAPRSVPLYPDKPYPTAIAVGPTVLAFRAPDKSPVESIDLKHLGTTLIPSPGEPLNYHVKGSPLVLARPFYAFKEGEPYYLYLDPKATRQIPYRMMKTSGTWHDSNQFFFGNQPGAWVEGTFEGTGVKLIAWAFDDAGRAEAAVDGKVIGTFDQFKPGRDLPFEWHIDGLSKGKHTIRFTILAEKSEASKDRFINIGGLEIIP